MLFCSKINDSCTCLILIATQLRWFLLRLCSFFFNIFFSFSWMIPQFILRYWWLFWSPYAFDRFLSDCCILVSGHLLAPLVAHTFCNFMGLPVLFSRRSGMPVNFPVNQALMTWAYKNVLLVIMFGINLLIENSWYLSVITSGYNLFSWYRCSLCAS